jgi:glycine oxidase
MGSRLLPRAEEQRPAFVGRDRRGAGFDTSVTAGGLYTLLEAGWRLVPGIYDLEVTESWAGLRPGSRDNDPVLGDSSAPGVVFATGHFRNGILLTPVTADEIARLVATGETSAWLEPFSPKRFSRTPAP